MNSDNEILWKGKTEVPANFWGLKSEGGRIHVDSLNRIVAYDRLSPIAIIIYSIVIIPLLILIFGSISIILGFIIGISLIIFLIYWLLIREIIYFQLVRSTEYEITKKEVRISYKLFGKVKKLIIPISQINKLHLLKFEEDGIENGSIYIYQTENLKSYDLIKRERTNQVKIERISDYQNVFNLIQSLRKNKL